MVNNNDNTVIFYVVEPIKDCCKEKDVPVACSGFCQIRTDPAKIENRIAGNRERFGLCHPYVQQISSCLKG